jgi:hypothetical protein
MVKKYSIVSLEEKLIKFYKNNKLVNSIWLKFNDKELRVKVVIDKLDFDIEYNAYQTLFLDVYYFNGMRGEFKTPVLRDGLIEYLELQNFKKVI